MTFSNYFAKEKLHEAFEPLDDIHLPHQVIDDITNHIRPCFIASLHEEAKVLKQQYLNTKSKQNSEDVNVKFLKNFNKLIEDTREYKSSLSRRKSYIISIDESIWGPWILNLINNDETTWKLISTDPVEEFINEFFGVHRNKLFIDIDNQVHTDLLEILVNPIEIENGTVKINLKEITRCRLRENINLFAQEANNLKDTLWNNYLLSPLSSFLSNHIKEIILRLFQNGSPNFFQAPVDNLINDIETFLNHNHELTISALKVVLINSKLFSKVYPDQKDPIKKEIIEKLYNDQRINHHLPAIQEVESLLNEF
jgi:hypothetical protein